MTLSTEYDRDFYNWILQNVALLRSGNLDQVDTEHIADELESMGKRDLRQLRSRLQVLLMHLLRWKYQPDKQTKSWRASIAYQRDAIETLLLDSPSLRGQLPQMLDSVYPKAVRDAVQETGLAEGRFPQACPFELSEILQERFLPDAEA